MDKDEWIYESIMSEEISMNEDTREELAVVENIDCSNVFNASQVLIWFCI